MQNSRATLISNAQSPRVASLLPGGGGPGIDHDAAEQSWTDRAVNGLQLLCAMVGMPILAMMITLDVIARYLVHHPFSWSSEFDQTLLLMILIGCMPYCTSVGAHVHMDVAYNRLRRPWKTIADFFRLLSGLVFFVGLAYAALISVPYFWKIEKATPYLLIPWWTIYAFVGVCSALSAWVLLHGSLKRADEIVLVKSNSNEQENI